MCMYKHRKVPKRNSLHFSINCGLVQVSGGPLGVVESFEEEEGNDIPDCNAA